MKIDKYHEMEKLEKFHWWFVYRQNVLKFVLKNYLASLKKDSAIIDIGCGTGGNLQLLSKDYTNIAGIDNNKCAIEYCKNKGLSNVRHGELPNLENVPDESIDLFLLFDVLEHVEDDKLSIEVLRNKLKPNGYILLTVPAFSFLWSQHDKDFHHKRRYNLKQIEKILTDCEFKIIKGCYLYFMLFPIILIARLLKKVFKKYSGADDFQLNNSFLNKIIIKLLSIEIKLLKIFNYPFGSSILLLVKK